MSNFFKWMTKSSGRNKSQQHSFVEQIAEKFNGVRKYPCVITLYDNITLARVITIRIVNKFKGTP